MNTTYKLLPALAALAFMGSCNDLDTEPMGGTVTSEQKEQVAAKDPSMAEAGVNALPMMTKQYCGVYNSSNVQSDFGWPASMLFMDSRTADMVSPNSGYNWFSQGLDYSDKNDNNRSTGYMWGTNYNMIYSCNSVLKTIDPETTNETLQYFMAQALGYRAWAYFNLAQMYQFTYVGSQDKPCVPIITEENSDLVAVEGAPRATVQEVYDQILSDINKAIDLLKGTGHIAPADRYAKQFINASSATGIRARVNLVMNNWSAAADDAQYVIQNSRCTPYSIAQVSKPSFWDASDSSWLLAIDVESGEVGNLHCWPGHFVSFYEGGYAGVSVFRKINKALFESIPDSDVRKGWWCDATGASPNLDAAHADVLYSLVEKESDVAYVNVKFDTYQSMFTGQCYLNDIPLLRIEEMYLTLAEAQAMSGNTGAGVATLNDFVKTYRNPQYNCTLSSAYEIQDEIWHQRRIELWGEGLAYYDIQRLKKPMDRIGGGFEPSVVFNIPADSPLRIYLIPLTETQTNPQLPSSANNPEGPVPTPIAE
ncbi:MAG: RagB/SusD family nutrient uptake outer membrane protein [Muribaculaceae bacterium]|nr:RagB/SusD family nutrient uptake outer membrane protein [Muribaculaceae bacterium]